MNHDEVYSDTWKDKTTNGYIMLKTMYCVLLSVMQDIVKLWKK